MELIEYTPEQRAIADFIDKLAKQFDRDYWCKKAETEAFPQEMWDVIAENGYFGMAVPEAYGGFDMKYADAAVFLEELGKHGIATLHFVAMFMDSILLGHGSEDLKKKFLPKLCAGELFSFAITEPDAGTNTFKMRTLAVKEGDYYRVNGQKLFITGGDESKYMVLVLRTKPYDKVEDKKDGISIFVLDSHTKGITMHRQDVEIFAPEKQYTVTFDDVMIPAENLIGEEHKGFQYLFDGLNLERIVIASYACGLGKFALQKGVEYANKRVLFDKPISAYQSIQHPLTRAFIGLNFASMAIQTAAKALDEKKASKFVGLYANMAKLTASEEAFKACDAAIQAHGGYGVTKEYHVINISNMVRAIRVAPINNEMVLNFIGETYLNMPKSY